VQLHPFELRVPDDLDKGFESAVQVGAQAVMTTEDAIQITYRAQSLLSRADEVIR
jgi:TPP-dependent pyruvate/acetoin dehydrogenase alpha subunit